MRPSDLPGQEGYEHGTRARYVAGCRCGPCTASNAEAWRERNKAADAAALDYGATAAPGATAENGRTYKRMCPGIDGGPCPNGSHLRKDSVGNLCGKCRHRLVWNGLVDAGPARRHLKQLSRAGVGYKSVADACDIARSVVAKILSGKRKKIRANTAKAILAVDTGAVADQALVDAAPMWRMIDRLMRVHGYTRGEIARRIGKKRRALQLGKRRVTARNYHKIAQLLRDAEE